MSYYFTPSSFHFDVLAIVMILLVTYIGTCVASFSTRYLKGDKLYATFLTNLILLIGSVIVMVSADQLLLLLIAFTLSNFLLVRLMIHKSSWQAAHASGMVAAKNYLVSTVCLAIAFYFFYQATGETSIRTINLQPCESILIPLGLALLLITSMAQSAIWPFHKWLLSSLNSPTPVSSIMHAGLVNAGGFLLVRFAPLYLRYPKLMMTVFCIGMVTAMLGTFWKLMQNDVKRMLACSTMGQMGFMFVQCGLGLFPLAVSHLFWHGLFKAYLFLASGNAAQEKRVDLAYPPKALPFFCALICGAVASCGFAYVSQESWLAGDGSLVLLVLAFISASQLALSILRTLNFKNLFLAFVITLTSGFVYGGSVHLFIGLLQPMKILNAEPLELLHLVGIVALVLSWLAILFLRRSSNSLKLPSWLLKYYVKGLNASQPLAATITAHRNNYNYQ